MIAPDNYHTALIANLRAWDRRWRTRQVLLWLPRLLLIPLAIGIILAILNRTSPLFTSQDIVFITGSSLITCLVGFIGLVFLRKRDPIKIARFFDVEFGLQERVSTALELLDKKIHADARFIAVQIADAQAHAQALAYRQHIKLIIRRQDWAIAIGVCVILIALLLLPNPDNQSLAQRQAQQAQINTSAEVVKDVIEDIANNPMLDSITRDQLLRELTTSLQTLQNPQVSTDEAIAVLSDVQALLEKTAQNITQRPEAEQAALQRAFETLQNAENQPPNLNAALDQIRQEITNPSRQNENTPPQQGENNPSNSQMTNQTQADALRNAARQLESVNPQLAQTLEQAAEALENDDVQTAAEALQQAQNQLEHMQQQTQVQQTQNQVLAQDLQRAAQHMQSQSQQLAQVQQPNPQRQNQTNQQPAGQQGQMPNQTGERDTPQQSGGTQATNAGQNDEQSASEQLSQANNNQQQNNQQIQGTTINNMNPTDNRPGNAQADLSQDTSGLNLNNIDQQEGNADRVGGERQYESIFTPLRLGGENSDNTIILAPDAEDVPIREGNFSDNQQGNITVPYNQVFNTYLQGVNTALENNYIPLGMRDVIRQYFTSLAPRTSSINTSED